MAGRFGFECAADGAPEWRFTTCDDNPLSAAPDTPAIITPVPHPADLNDDGFVNAADLALLLGAWNTPGADLNGDRTTDAADLALLLGAGS